MTDATWSVGRYRIVRHLGHGRLGDLFLAVDPKLERQVALRLLPPLAEDTRARFGASLLATAGLLDPTLATIFDYGDHDGRLFFIREYVEGRTLAQIIAEKASIPLARRLEWIADLCMALARAHGKNVIGLSLAPSNVIITQADQPRILDTIPLLFDTDAAAVLEASYPSPEAIAGLVTDRRSDIFAAGGLLYELITYEKPFGTGSPAEVWQRILVGRWIRTDALDPALAAIVMRALQVEPGARYQDFSAFLSDLSRIRRHADNISDIIPSMPASPPAPPSSRSVDSEMLSQRRAAQIARYLADADAAFRDKSYEQALEFAERALMLDEKHEQALEIVERARAALDARWKQEPKTPDDDARTIELATARRIDDNVRFTVYRPAVMSPRHWYPLLFFTHLSERRSDAPAGEPDPVAEVERAARHALRAAVASFPRIVQDAGAAIPHEALLRIVPAVPGVTFNPPEYSFLWLESVHRADFHIRADASLQGRTARGSIEVRMGAVPVGVVTVAIPIEAHAPAQEPAVHDVGQPYRRIFASYSHKDTAIVRQFESYARGIGDSYMRDVMDLRAGEVWNDRLLEMIDGADVFQLFWSTHSMLSPFVRREWEHALTVARSDFIRPLYWESPFPEREGLPPPALKMRHFASVAIPDIVDGEALERQQAEEESQENERHRQEAERRGLEAARMAEEARQRASAEAACRMEEELGQLRALAEERRRRVAEDERRACAENEARTRAEATQREAMLDGAAPVPTDWLELGDEKYATRTEQPSAPKPRSRAGVIALLALLAVALVVLFARC